MLLKAETGSDERAPCWLAFSLVRIEGKYDDQLIPIQIVPVVAAGNEQARIDTAPIVLFLQFTVAKRFDDGSELSLTEWKKPSLGSLKNHMSPTCSEELTKSMSERNPSI